MRSFIRPLAITALMVVSSQHVQAANFSFSGDIAYNTDLVQIAFTLDGANSATRLWTDSWQSGLNFDPNITLWVKDDQGFSLVAHNDDDNSIDASQGYYDSGLNLPVLAAGRYLVTLGAAPNYALGTQLSDGFAFQGINPTLVTEWNQPSYDLNANDQKGTFWRVNLEGVSTASAVPEPRTGALLLAGVAIVFLTRRSRHD